MQTHERFNRAQKALSSLVVTDQTPEIRVKAIVDTLQAFSSAFAILAKGSTTRTYVDPKLDGIKSLYKSSAMLNRATSSLKKVKTWADEPLSPRAEAFFTKARLKIGVIDKDPKAVDLGAMEDVLVLIAKGIGAIKNMRDVSSAIIKSVAMMERAFGRKWVYLIPNKAGHVAKVTDAKPGKVPGTFRRTRGAQV